MQLRTEAVDRVLEALSPALTAEIERLVEETRQKLEAEFEARLRGAIRDAEEATRLAGDVERQQAVEKAIEQTQQAVRSEVTNQLQVEYDRRLAEVSSSATSHEAEFQRAQNEWNSERERLQKQMDQWRAFAEAQRQLTEASSQPELLIRWLNVAENFANSVAVYTSKADGLALWKSRGNTVFPQVISQQTTDPELYFKPLVVRGKTLAAVSASQPFQSERLDFLSTTLERAIELFGFRLRTK